MIQRIAVKHIGIISACAEQTTEAGLWIDDDRDHLRVCGADYDGATGGLHQQGSSPRVRSRRAAVGRYDRGRGIISACAEQTNRHLRRILVRGDHLRVCGADALGLLPDTVDEGSSPRVRSRPNGVRDVETKRGIISACAEQTWRKRAENRFLRDHLRVCGADYPGDISDGYHTGSSPRVRSRHVKKVQADTQKGIISACAEQTSRRSGRWIWGWDHLRVCGADVLTLFFKHSYFGSSPRVRSRHVGFQPQPHRARIISACAEQT